MKKQKQIYLVLIVSVSLLISAVGCDQEGYSAANTSAFKHFNSEDVNKPAAAAALQEMIRKSKGLSVYHQGFKPAATPPCPPPSWTPQEKMEVNEIEIRTIYLVQHWYDEKEFGKTSGDLIGFDVMFRRWEGRLGQRTSHDFSMKLSDVRRVWIERPAFSKWIIVHIYYLPENNEEESQVGEQEFKIWFESKMFGKKQESSFLTALGVLCPNIE